jgi:hypothetical protein
MTRGLQARACSISVILPSRRRSLTTGTTAPPVCLVAAYQKILPDANGPETLRLSVDLGRHAPHWCRRSECRAVISGLLQTYRLALFDEPELTVLAMLSAAAASFVDGSCNKGSIRQHPFQPSECRHRERAPSTWGNWRQRRRLRARSAARPYRSPRDIARSRQSGHMSHCQQR